MQPSKNVVDTCFALLPLSHSNMQKYTLYRSSCLNITRTFFALGFSLKFPKLLILSLPTPHAICTPCLKNVVIIFDALKILTKMNRFLTMKHPNNFCISYLQGEGKKLLSGLRMMEKKTFNNICCKVFFQKFMEKEEFLR